nr:NYN domain-containing protein [uncultured Halomonas sp.]
MNMSFAIFLDAGFIKHKLRRPKSPPVTAQKINDLVEEIRCHPHLQGMFLHRVYFYDARPMEGDVVRPDGTKQDFGKTPLARNNKALHKELAEIPFFSLRYGELSLQGWKFSVAPGKTKQFPLTLDDADKLKPDVAQKGVDMRIGLDMASLTLKEHVQVIALVTGDSDFIPAMKFARREGAQVMLFTLGHGIKDGVAEHADLVVREKPGSLPKPTP